MARTAVRDDDDDDDDDRDRDRDLAADYKNKYLNAMVAIATVLRRAGRLGGRR